MEVPDKDQAETLQCRVELVGIVSRCFISSGYWIKRTISFDMITRLFPFARALGRDDVADFLETADGGRAETGFGGFGWDAA